ncbi:NAD(P)-dependent oxidoreductase [Shinella yambaruensis]|uniref:Nucleoside-diphosphate sugar epimerase n=1 Tax=Shinella yambaruensis TaxID=415996 RepID=A0ABQ5ZRH5_9HYPH|nr:NAD(P)-dependent oxidoreductase [Shinella yambaruensis]MCJ8026269.1 NAD(P)-dependent oxidoreductase [Shinella yambaruensis]MCU7981676.1 NAD(P)-dependent oxidoreductase [Shinella yambaruensis]GLR53621.1 nucleoside-diphosphate sugar epimerase [Shinella yambaruensis]
MRVLITGAGGFIGAWAIRRFIAADVAVRAFDIRSDRRIPDEVDVAAADAVEWSRGDITDAAAVEKAARGCAAIVHLAGLQTPACMADPVAGAMVNVIGTLNVFRAALSTEAGFVVYASSAAVFGPDNGHTPFPVTHYGTYKLANEGNARAFFREEGLSSIGLRPFTVYGPGRDTGLSAGFTLACRAAAERRPYVIGLTGASDMLFVDDVAAAIETAVATRPKGASAFSLIGETASVEDFIREIGRHVPDAQIRAEGPPISTYFELTPDRIETVLPGLPRTPLEAGVRRTINHYRRRVGR